MEKTEKEMQFISNGYFLDALESISAAYDYLQAMDEDDQTESLAKISSSILDHYHKYIEKK